MRSADEYIVIGPEEALVELLARRERCLGMGSWEESRIHDTGMHWRLTLPPFGYLSLYHFLYDSTRYW
jgi:hypothetical protein